MSTQDPVRTRPGTTDGATSVARPGPLRERRTTETKAAFKTTELIAYVVTVIAVLIAAAVVDDASGQQVVAFDAKSAWLYVTILTAAYMISRGLAKSGSRDPYWDDDDGSGRNGR